MFCLADLFNLAENVPHILINTNLKFKEPYRIIDEDRPEKDPASFNHRPGAISSLFVPERRGCEPERKPGTGE